MEVVKQEWYYQTCCSSNPPPARSSGKCRSLWGGGRGCAVAPPSVTQCWRLCESCVPGDPPGIVAPWGQSFVCYGIQKEKLRRKKEATILVFNVYIQAFFPLSLEAKMEKQRHFLCQRSNYKKIIKCGTIEKDQTTDAALPTLIVPVLHVNKQGSDHSYHKAIENL